MPDVTITIPDEKLERVVNALIGLYPIPLIDDLENEGEKIPEFAENQWAKQCVINFLKRSVARYEQREAKDAIVYNEDGTIVS